MPLFVSGAEDAAGSPVVVENRDTVPYRPPIEEEPASGAFEAQYQLQLLQQEVMMLRGQVDQLRHELEREKALQAERYLDLDNRLQQTLRAPAPAIAAPVETPAGSPAASPPVVIDDNLGEKDFYDTIHVQIRNRQHELAIAQLEAFIARFPDGEYTPNAYYWLGQMQAAKPNPDFEKARQALAQVIGYFPDDRKVPDATFALGRVYHALGDCARATELLRQVTIQYPGTSVANLAEKYLRESVDCDS